jgi:transmembrane sensor
MSESKYWYLTGKYLSKNLTKEEQTELESWIEANSANKELFESHIKLWESFSAQTKEIDFNSKNSWLELQALIENKSKQKSTKIRTLSIWRSVAAAAIVIILIAVGTVLYVNRDKSVVLATTTNKQLFFLPDSTKVWLNKNSQLSYNSEFGDNKREVQLNGEAYFEVQHNPEKPFIIESHQTYTKVIGTKFNVSSYNSDSVVTVSVVQGKVQFGIVKSESQPLFLTQNCTGTFTKKSKRLEIFKSENINDIAWQTNKLVFSNSPFPYLISQLEKYYNIKIDSKKVQTEDFTFTGTFNKQTLDEVIKILESTLNLSFTRINDSNYSVAEGKSSN